MANRIPFPAHLINQTHATVRKAFDDSTELCSTIGDLDCVNISSIETMLIQDTGRFVENYASDLLITLAHVQELCRNVYPLEQEIDEIFVFGLRKNGVDHSNYVMDNLMHDVNQYQPYLHVDRYYRRVLAVRVQVSYTDFYTGERWSQPRVKCELRNITNAFHRPNPADLDEKGQLMYTPFPNGNPVPVDLYPVQGKDGDATGRSDGQAAPGSPGDAPAD